MGSGGLVVLLLLSAIAVLSQNPPPIPIIYSVNQDGFDVAFLDDISFVTELHPMSFPPNNFSMFIWGSDRVRAIYPSMTGFSVGISPNEDWHLPFIDLHTIQNGTDLWGFGPIDPIPGVSHGVEGYSLDVAIVTTKYDPSYRYYRFSPLGTQGAFFSVRPLFFGSDILGYFAGFFPDAINPLLLHFGVLRAFFNISAIDPTNPTNNPRWSFNATNDVAIIVNNSQLYSYNAFIKPIVFHAFNISGIGNPNVTYTIVVDPGTRFVRNIIGSINPGTPLTVTTNAWSPIHYGYDRGTLSSATIYYPTNTLIIGIAMPGTGTGAIAFLSFLDFSTKAMVALPTNYSDPKALAIDEFQGNLYVAMNGGGNIIRISLSTYQITGYQTVPPYLSRAWAGRATFEHVYFVTNEQHTKVFRMSKVDFCTNPCPNFGFCQAGKCVCAPGFDQTSNGCEWHTIINDNNIIKKDQAGEATLGVFFALSFVAAAVGWFLYYRTRRSGYQNV